ncbi:prepilin-type N-terminal cleavage/methylation domain-containing protein [Marinimicrobium alkaliphilum]|uniref:prepilin-type N-terminal cleavage/methylation domain-containing protein n=1 Tax=Marinimicrobium alkaliphilum TaxID=2202654 RepID=UPI000DBA0F72|nr:prepilin-type N-terminal cleavage/methylation domain-containing protein [Marinimicrobium alkaliphilum]
MMRRQGGMTLLELLLSLAIILTLIGVFVYKAADFTRDIRHHSVDIAANSFSVGVSGVRYRWYLAPEQVQREGVEVQAPLSLDDEGEPVSRARIYVNDSGWPVAAQSVDRVSGNTLSDRHCQQLWGGLLVQDRLRNLSDATSAPSFQPSWQGDHCRYQLATSEGHYFRYSPATGEIAVVTPRKP